MHCSSFLSNHFHHNSQSSSPNQKRKISEHEQTGLIHKNAVTKISAFLSSVHRTQPASTTVPDSPADATTATKQAKKVFVFLAQKPGDSLIIGTNLLKRLLQVLMKTLIFTFPEDPRVNQICVLTLTGNHLLE